MAFKLGVGKKTAVSMPANGTIKVTSPSLPTVGASLSAKSKSSTSAIEKVEATDPAEVIAIVDFNRVYENAESSVDTLSAYGVYFDALDSVHSITTDDVTYAVTKALANDTSGAWAALKKTTDSDIADAADFVDDLKNFLDSFEAAEKSLDFGRSGDKDIQNAAAGYLEGRIKTYEKKVEDRVFELSNIIGESATTNKNADSLREVLDTLRNTLTKEKVAVYKTILDGLSQKNFNDLNARTGNENGKAFKMIDKLGTGVTGKLLGCAELLSHVMLLSTGIQRVKSDPISSRINFNQNKIDAIFNGSSVSDRLPFRSSLANGNLGSNIVSLSLIQYDMKDGGVAIPVELENSPTQPGYISGPESMIRRAISTGDFNFTDFDAFTGQFEKNRAELETYLELMLGYLDPQNELTPLGILRIIIKNFMNGLNAAKSVESAFYELHATALAAQEVGGTQSLDEENGIENLRQEILRTVARLKYAKLTSQSTTSNSDDGPGSAARQLITKVFNGSDTSTTPTTTLTQTEDITPVPATRVIERLASGSPEKIEDMMYEQVALRAKSGAYSAAEIKKMIADKEVEIRKAKSELFRLRSELANEDNDALEINYYAVIDELEKKIENLNAELDELKSLQSVSNSNLISKETLIGYYFNARRSTSTSGTFMSSMLDTYDEIVDLAKERLPAGTLMVDDRGLTLFGSLDEYGILSLIVECFVRLASQIRFITQRNGKGGIFITPKTTAFENLRYDLSSLLSNNIGSISGRLTSSSAPGTSTALDSCFTRIQSYQDSHAYLSAYSDGIKQAKDSLKSAVAELISTAARRSQVDTASGRQMLQTLTSQQLIYRRSLLDKYLPLADLGYLPARTAYSADEASALEESLSSPLLSNRTSDNIRIMFAGIPVGTINESRRYVNADVGNVSYTGMVELAVHRHDHEFEDLIFKEKIFLFDPQLYVTPDSFTGYANVTAIGTDDPILALASRIKFTIYDRDGSQQLDYKQVLTNERYSQLSRAQVNAILKNTLLSYMLESYMFKLSGMLFDESVSININDSISQAGIAAITAASSLGLPDLKLPTAQQLSAMIGSDGEVNFTADVPGVTTGDRELVSAIASSYLIKSEKPIDRLLVKSKFDRVFAVPVDPDEFVIDMTLSISENGESAFSLINSLRHQALIKYSDNNESTLLRRDPLAGGFSIGSLSVQFTPHTVSEESGTLLRMATEKMLAKPDSRSLNLSPPKKLMSSNKV